MNTKLITSMCYLSKQIYHFYAPMIINGPEAGTEYLIQDLLHPKYSKRNFMNLQANTLILYAIWIMINSHILCAMVSS